MHMLAPLIYVALPALLVTAPVPKVRAKVTDQDVIRGVWKVDKMDLGDLPAVLPQVELDKMRFVFEADGVLRTSGGVVEGMKCTYKIDSEADPKTIDLSLPPTCVGNAADLLPGLYSLDGDTLKICIVLGTNQQRPSEIKADGKTTAVITFSRVKEPKAVNPDK